MSNNHICNANIATDAAVGTSSAKLKGTGSTGNPFNYQEATVYDAMDLVVPGNEENAFFITTSHIITPSQTRGICNGTSDTVCFTSMNTESLCVFFVCCASGHLFAINLYFYVVFILLFCNRGIVHLILIVQQIYIMQIHKVLQQVHVDQIHIVKYQVGVH